MFADFPEHNIPPSEKDKEWILKFAKAIYSDYDQAPLDSLFHKREVYREIMDYAQGKHSVDKFKPQLSIDDENNAWVALDYSPIPIYTRLRKVALALVNKADWNILATPIDQHAADEMQEAYKNAKGRIRARNEMAKIAPDMLQFSNLALKDGEAESIEELDLKASISRKHKMSEEMEMAITLALFQNQFSETRSNIKQYLFDFGVGGYKVYIDHDGKIKIRRVNPENLITNRVEHKDFSDLLYAGEILYVSPSGFKSMAQNQFTKDEYEEISKKSFQGDDRPNRFTDALRRDNKIAVLDFEFLSSNTYTYIKGKDDLGNPKYIRYDGYTPEDQEQEVVTRTVDVVYKGKWVVGTDYIFDYGLATDIARAKKGISTACKLSYHIRATNLYSGRIVGTTEQAMVIVDAIQLAWLKLQQAIAEAKPRGIRIDIASITNVSLMKSGEAIRPLDVIDLYKQTGTLIYSSVNVNGEPTNWSPIDELNNGIGDEAIRWFNHLQSNIQLLRQTIGLNDLTDASTPDPRTLTTTAQMAYEGTNNSLWDIIEADKYLLESVANTLTLYIQDVVKYKPMSGYVLSLGNETVKFININPKVSNYEYGILLENKPDDQQRQELMQLAISYAGKGEVDFEDIILLKNTDNLKQGEKVLSYQIKKRRERNHTEAMQLQQANGQVQMQSAQSAEAAKQQTLQLEYQLKMQQTELEKQWDYKIAMLKIEGQLQDAQGRDEAKVTSSLLQANSKEFTENMKLEQQGTTVASQ